ncbi:RDD family protein [Cellulomonas sp. NPDC089187]|uniref:RDD family protein n=1 Tax=Cellulomonas sp. NPDC089187 TaxID=3154970 RepID=UPI003442F24E
MPTHAACPICAADLDPGAAFCGSCGQRVPVPDAPDHADPFTSSVDWPAAAPNPARVPTSDTPPPSADTARPAPQAWEFGLDIEDRVAPIGRRLLALLVDQIAAALLVGVAVVLILPTLRDQLTPGVLLIPGLVALVVAAAQWMAEAFTGATAGSALLGIRTLSVRTGRPAGLWAVLLRGIVQGLGSLLAGVGVYVIAASGAWDESPARRGWHDKAAGTMVLRASAVRAGRRGETSVGAASGGPDGAGAPAAGWVAPAAGGAAPWGVDPLATARGTDPHAAAGPDAMVTATGIEVPGPSASVEVATPPAPPALGGVPTSLAPAAPPVPAAPALPTPTRAEPPAPPMPVDVPMTPASATSVSSVDAPQASEPGDDGQPARDPSRPEPALLVPEAVAHPSPAPADRPSTPAHTTPPPPPLLPVDTLPTVAAQPTPPSVPEGLGELELTRVAGPRTHTPVRMAFDTGELIEVTGPGLVGRNPFPLLGDPDPAHLVAITDPAQSVSRVHFAFRPEPGGLVVVDQNSTNGTVLVDPAGNRWALPAGQEARVTPGWLVLFGERTVVIESV